MAQLKKRVEEYEITTKREVDRVDKYDSGAEEWERKRTDLLERIALLENELAEFKSGTHERVEMNMAEAARVINRLQAKIIVIDNRGAGLSPRAYSDLLETAMECGGMVLSARGQNEWREIIDAAGPYSPGIEKAISALRNGIGDFMERMTERHVSIIPSQERMDATLDAIARISFSA